jgi:hypothetical protein
MGLELKLYNKTPPMKRKESWHSARCQIECATLSILFSYLIKAIINQTKRSYPAEFIKHDQRRKCDE